MLTVDDVLAANGVVPALERLRARGLIAHIGCCAYGGERSAIAKLIDSGAFETVLVYYSLANRERFRSVSAGLARLCADWRACRRGRLWA